jgi:cytochrome c peroxidase
VYTMQSVASGNTSPAQGGAPPQGATPRSGASRVRPDLDLCRRRPACTAALLLLLLATLPAPTPAREPIEPVPLSVPFDREKALLGKRLFFDPRLSADNKISCASCHDPYEGGDDGLPVSVGVFGQLGDSNAPTVLNSYFNFRQFWNGRAADLAEQAAGPLHNPKEMAMNSAAVEAILESNGDYRRGFREIYGDDDIAFKDVLDAIAEFEKALYTPNARFDLYLRGEADLTTAERDGYLLFKRLGCVSCHNGVNVGGNAYQYLGVVNLYHSEAPAADRHRLTGDPFDSNRFKVPTLRNIELTRPYLHHGKVDTLAEVLNKMAYHNLGIDYEDDELNNLIAFLKSLTGDTPAILDRP